MATFVVTNTNDSGAGSLRDAIANAEDASGADTITFASGLSGQTIVLSRALEIFSDFTIDGDLDDDGRADITVDQQGDEFEHVFWFQSGSSKLDGVVATGGGDYGAGIYVGGGALELSNSEVVGNAFGGLHVLSNDGVVVTNSSFTGNSGSYGGIRNAGMLTISGGEVSGNTTTADFGNAGGISNGAGASLIVTGTRFEGNDGGDFGAGAISNFEGDVELTDVEIVDNEGGDGGGLVPEMVL